MQTQTQTLTRQTQEISDFQPLIDNLTHLVAVSRQKFDLVRVSNSDKMKWGRLLISGCEAIAKLMVARKVEDLTSRVELLENQTTRGWQASNPPLQSPLQENLFDRLHRLHRESHNEEGSNNE